MAEPKKMWFRKQLLKEQGKIIRRGVYFSLKWIIALRL